MVWSLQWKTGLVFGLEYEEVMFVDEDDEKDKGTVCNCIVVHLGVFTLNFMY
jgi:hypothetical protein